MRSEPKYASIIERIRMKGRGNVPVGLLIIFLCAVCASCAGRARTEATRFPDVVLWAWERPEDLSFINPNKVAVAYLALSIRLSGDRVLTQPRLQPLRVPKGTYMIGVVRISPSIRSVPALSSAQMKTAVDRILGVARLPGVRGIQTDFDATKSERPFYRGLLDRLRKKLPDSLSLSITALASWCLEDTWIRGLPIDDAVPMLFRLGPDRLKILRYLAKGGDFALPVCRHSVGISTDEPLPVIPAGRRIYIFNPHPWSRETFESIMKGIKR